MDVPLANLLILLATASFQEPASAPARVPLFIEPSTARDGLERGALAVDVRSRPAFEKSRVPGAIHLPWEALTPKAPKSGDLPAAAELARRVGAAGIRPDRPLIVYGRFQAGWGEEGRVAWTLRAAGMRKVQVLAGGMAGWIRAALPLERGPATERRPVEFPVPERLPGLVRYEEMRQLAGGGDVRILDVRTRGEFEGSTPYGSPRGGHLPGAVLFPFESLFREGRLLPVDELLKLDALRDLPRDRPLITYCTGGVRSAFAALVLETLGFENVRNYAGSWWEWSRRPPSDSGGRAADGGYSGNARSAAFCGR